VAGLATTLGSGSMTNSIEDLAKASCIFLIGSNPTSNHPVLALRIKEAVKKGAILILANPRRGDLNRYASLWLRLKPGSDVALLMGMARVILEESLFDEAFIRERTEGFEEFKESLKEFDLERVEALTGVPKEKIREAARLYATLKPSSIVYCMGITQHAYGTNNVFALSNLALLTGNLGKPGAGVNPLRGQNNVQGACDMGALPNLLPGYKRVDDEASRRAFEEAWGVKLPEKPGLTLTEIFSGCLRGEIKALWIVGENPVVSDPDSEHVEEALKKVEFLIVQDLFLSETARFAHVVLPAASFAEKDGTFTNTERRVQRVRKALEPIGDSKPDYWIVKEVAKRMGGKGFEWGSAEEIFEEIRKVVPSYRGISYKRLEENGIFWPCPSEDHPGTPYLYQEGFLRPGGKGLFMPLKYLPPVEEPDEEYPFVLTTARSPYQYHTMTMTGRIPGLMLLKGFETVEINPEDANPLGIKSGDRVRIRSRRGEVEAVALVSEDTPKGVLTMSFHFPETRTNLLFSSSLLDPISKMPELKVIAVRIEKV